MLFKQTAEIEDGGLVRNTIIAQLDPGKTAHRLAVLEAFLGHGIAQRVPALQEVHAQHRLERHRRAAARGARLRIERVNQRQ